MSITTEKAVWFQRNTGWTKK